KARRAGCAAHPKEATQTESRGAEPGGYHMVSGPAYSGLGCPRLALIYGPRVRLAEHAGAEPERSWGKEWRRLCQSTRFAVGRGSPTRPRTWRRRSQRWGTASASSTPT